MFPRGAYGQRLPDDVVIYDKDPDGSFGHRYTDEAARFEPSTAAAEEQTIDYEYFDAAAPSVLASAPDSGYERESGRGRYTRHMTSADRLRPTVATTTPAPEHKERGWTRRPQTFNRPRSLPRSRQHRKLTEPYTLRAPHPFSQKVVTVTKEDWIEDMKERYYSA